ncbi:MAG: dinitrogenase iron-molybdenum cofactor biosynthesis protein [Gammaproteobacteria bacterium]
MNEPISKDIALRIALAARVLPDFDAAQLLKALDELVGLPPTKDSLATLTVKQLKATEAVELGGVETDLMKEALAYLKGDKGLGQEALPTIQVYTDGDMPNSIRVACASNNAEDLDGHFGSCARFLIYQVDSDEIRLIDIRPTDGPEARDDKNAYRSGLIADCQVLFVASIGGPAAAKVVKSGVHPIKHLNGGTTRERMTELQAVLALTPPPWLAKVMGYNEEERVRFEREAEVGA